jgi:hypothetical protein
MTLRRESVSARRESDASAGVLLDFDAPERADANHHLWQNGRLWWIAFTVHRGFRQDRIRLSLGTDDVAVARQRRDEMLALFARARDLRISLRFKPQFPRRPTRRRC